MLQDGILMTSVPKLGLCLVYSHSSFPQQLSEGSRMLGPVPKCAHL